MPLSKRSKRLAFAFETYAKTRVCLAENWQRRPVSTIRVSAKLKMAYKRQPTKTYMSGAVYAEQAIKYRTWSRPYAQLNRHTSNFGGKAAPE